jgi:hypothetical protein
VASRRSGRCVLAPLRALRPPASPASDDQDGREVRAYGP